MQRDPGKTIDCSRGSRTMHTLRKLPAASPSAPDESVQVYLQESDGHDEVVLQASVEQGGGA